MLRLHFNLVITTCLINLAEIFAYPSLSRVSSMRGIGYLSIMVFAVQTSVIYANSQFPNFLMDKQNEVIVLRCTRLYPAFFEVFLQVILYFLQFHFTFLAAYGNI